MASLNLILLRFLLITILVVVISASPVHRNKHTKSQYSTLPYNANYQLRNKNLRRSWTPTGGYSMPPYLVFNKKLGAYYPYFKYPENRQEHNTVRRTVKKTTTYS